MIYRLGFWTGPVPADAESACADLHTRIYSAQRRRLESGCRPPPAPDLRRFVDAVLAEIPSSPEEKRCPWSDGDVAGAATAETFLPLMHTPDRRAIALLTQLAHEHGLHGFDLTAHRTLSMADVYWIEDVPWTNAILGVDPATAISDLSAARETICRGPEIARERLVSPSGVHSVVPIEQALGTVS